MEMTPKPVTISVSSIFFTKASDYSQLVKMRLSLLVLFSSIAGYFSGVEIVDLTKLLALCAGGFLVTGSSNVFNQIIEKDTDKLMRRTAMRPLPTGRMHVPEAFITAMLMGISGISTLWFYINPLCGLLSSLALVVYVAVYTPLKKITAFSVMVGAFPGAIPPMLGWVAATGKFSLEAGILFAIQFIWQFVHVWALAWKLDEDYKKAAFRLLPSSGNKNKSTAFQILLYSLFLIPAAMLPWIFDISGFFSALIGIVSGIWVTFNAFILFISLKEKAALKLLLSAYLFLPLVLLALIFDKI